MRRIRQMSSTKAERSSPGNQTMWRVVKLKADLMTFLMLTMPLCQVMPLMIQCVGSRRHPQKCSWK